MKYDCANIWQDDVKEDVS